LRARTQEELNSPERIARLSGHPAQLPKYFRELVRRQFAEEHINFLHDTAMGDQTFQTPVAVPGAKDHPPHVEVVEVEAPSVVRVRAAELILAIAIPRQSGLVDGDDRAVTGVVLLPALEAESTNEEHGREVIEEEVGLDESRTEDRDEAPPPVEQVIDPKVVANVLARRRARGGAANGDKALGAHNGA
jgi:hypothetical protein